ncbi:protein KAKU4 isoform X1 [Vigna radiata var. radiata]|uniref:Protein KAKU4 isoform X1 n=1 Tax=Vigna radiata var. radiata TaxID=3916 RepID=A0A3Q0F287_VIGRR|nr:protein KAKU4 isoform X1 [Vigna radiata var. radiata]
MASAPGSRSGGKILRTRRSAAARSRTPYDRPAPAEAPSPNWLSRFVLSPSRFIASGAGKIFSSVLDLDNASASSSSSSSAASSSPSSSSNNSDAEEVGTLDDENDKRSEGDVALSKDGTSGLINFSVKELQPFVGNSKNKHIIEQLILKESFSREECDRLIKIIRSRVVDPANDDNGDKRPTDILNKTPGSDSPDLHSAAVMEAKKWLQEKKSGLDTTSVIGYGSPSLNLFALPQDPKDEGSPVDVAKSYMRTRPPWASPSIDHPNSKTPSGVQLFKEETPYLLGNNSTPSSKLKRGSAATGSWSIQDEIRRVRFRATEDLLRTLPSSKIDWSTLGMENKNNVDSSAIENIGASLSERVHNSTNLVDASANLTRGFGSQVSPDLESKQDGSKPESVLAYPVNIDFEQNQVSVAVQQTKGTQDDSREITTSGLQDGSSSDMYRGDGLIKINGINDTNRSGHQLDSVEETKEATNSRLQDSNHLVIKEKVRAEDELANGFPSSEPSFNAAQVIGQNTKTLEEKELNTNDSSQERTAQVVLEQEACKTLSESMDVPDVIGNADGVASGSQNSSSVYEVHQDTSQPIVESGLPDTPTSIAKQKGRRVTATYNSRRSRNRGVK